MRFLVRRLLERLLEHTRGRRNVARVAPRRLWLRPRVGDIGAVNGYLTRRVTRADLAQFCDPTPQHKRTTPRHRITRPLYSDEHTRIFTYANGGISEHDEASMTTEVAIVSAGTLAPINHTRAEHYERRSRSDRVWRQ